jgi:alkaline phosphatase D
MLHSARPLVLERRKFLKTLAAGAAVSSSGIARVLAQGIAPAIITRDSARPQLPYGVMSGDVTEERVVIWSRSDRPARMVIEYAANEQFRGASRVLGPAAIESSDFTARVDVTGLPSGQDVFYRVSFQDLADPKVYSAPFAGRLRMPPADRRSVTFAFSGDEAGQGWGINPDWGGYRVYETMRKFDPDFFIHSGDQIYADGPLSAEVKLDNGTVWKNLVTPAKTKVAETLDEFRGNFAYNLLDENKRHFASQVPFLVQWDDHEVRNNWYPGQQIGEADKRYQVRRTSLLAARARCATLEYNPFRINPLDPEQIYRSFRYGPSLDVFMLDERSYRGPNSPNRQTVLNDESAFLGRGQLDWLKAALARSTATWKVIASDMPISLVVPDANVDVPKGTYEAWANADDGPPAGRELEIAELLSFIKARDIKNVVWVTADVHYAQATYYDPARASFSDFKPFWEFVGGPINAGTFGPNEVDRTFGPDIRYVSVPRGMRQNRPPSDGLQYFGLAKIDAQTRTMTVSLHDLTGKSLYRVTLDPET